MRNPKELLATKAANQVGPRLSVARNSRHWCDLACVVAPQLCPMAMLRSVDSVFNTLIKAKGHLTMSVDFDSVRDPYYPRQLTTHHCSAHTLRKAGWCQRHIATDTSHFRVPITACCMCCGCICPWHMCMLSVVSRSACSARTQRYVGCPWGGERMAIWHMSQLSTWYARTAFPGRSLVFHRCT